MRRYKIMQLIVLLALLLYGGKGENAKLFKQFKPLLESVGGDDVKKALKEAEELEGVISAFGNMTHASGTVSPSADREDSEGTEGGRYEAPAAHKSGDSADGENNTVGEEFPLAPIAGIADREILYRMVQYFSQSG